MARKTAEHTKLSADVRKGFNIELRALTEHGGISGLELTTRELAAMTVERDQLREQLQAQQNPSLAERGKRLAGDVLAFSMLPAMAVVGTFKAINNWSGPEEE